MLDFHEATGALKRLRADKDGVVSFEYVIVAACIVAAVGAAFGSSTSTGIGQIVSTAISNIGTAINGA